MKYLELNAEYECSQKEHLKVLAVENGKVQTKRVVARYIGSMGVYAQRDMSFGYTVYIKYPCGYALRLRGAWFDDGTGKDVSPVPENLLFPEGFVAWLEDSVHRGFYAPLNYLAMAEKILGDGERLKGVLQEAQAVRAKVAKREEERAQEAIAEALKEEKRREKEETERIETKKQQLLGILRSGTDRYRLDDEEKSLLLDIARDVGAAFPLRVAGWIKDKLQAIRIEDGKLTGYCASTHSNTVFQYFNKMLENV